MIDSLQLPSVQVDKVDHSQETAYTTLSCTLIEVILQTQPLHRPYCDPLSLGLSDER